MKKRTLSLWVAALLCLALLPGALAEDAAYGIIQGGSLHMRSGPSQDDGVVQTYDSGTWVEILEDAGNGFYHVIADNGREGYMMSEYIIEDTLEAGDWGTVENGDRYVNLRSGPSTSDDVIARYYTGDRFELLKYGEVFSKVRFDGNVVGYMSSGLVRLDDETVWKEEYVHTASGGKLNIRSGPSTQAKVLGSYPEGTEIIVLIAGNEWDKVFVKDTFGYMDAAYLAASKQEQQQARHRQVSERQHAAEGTNPFHNEGGPVQNAPQNQPAADPKVTMAPHGDPLVISYDDNSGDSGDSGDSGTGSAGSDFNPAAALRGPGLVVNPSQSDG